MPVGELLHRISAKELSEWQAYEQATGPINRLYSDDVLAAIHEQLQVIAHLAGAEMEENPVPVPSRVKRPYELSVPAEGEESMSRDEFDTQF